MSQHFHIAYCAAFAAIVVGCGRGSHSPESGETDAIVNVRTVDSAYALAKVGDHVVTCGDFRERLDFECGLWRMRHQTASDMQKGLDEYCSRRMEKILPELLNQTGASVRAKERGISLTPEEGLAAERQVLRSLGFKGDTVAFANKIGCTPEYAARQLQASALMDKVRIDFEPASTNLTEREIDEGLERMEAYYQRAIASNAVTWATCSNVMNQISKGLDFAKAAERYSYDNAEEGEKWGDFLPVELSDATLKAWAYSAPVGTMKVFELDDGISIVKILGRKAGTTEPSVVSEGEAEVTLSRINFIMIEPEPEPRTREHVRSALLQWKRGEAQKRLFDAILREHPLTYPNGAVRIGI